MKLEDFTSEMLDEIKSAKDLVKGELPELAKEYINMQTLMAKLGIGLGVTLVTVGIVLGLISYLHVNPRPGYDDDFKIITGFLGGLSTFVGCMLTACNGSTYLEFKLQPRRMAIKAITSLKLK